MVPAWSTDNEDELLLSCASLSPSVRCCGLRRLRRNRVVAPVENVDRQYLVAQPSLEPNAIKLTESCRSFDGVIGLPPIDEHAAKELIKIRPQRTPLRVIDLDNIIVSTVSSPPTLVSLVQPLVCFRC